MLVFNSQESLPTFCSGLEPVSWIVISIASLALTPSVVDLAVRDDIEILSNHKLIVT